MEWRGVNWGSEVSYPRSGPQRGRCSLVEASSEPVPARGRLAGQGPGVYPATLGPHCPVNYTRGKLFRRFGGEQGIMGNPRKSKQYMASGLAEIVAETVPVVFVLVAVDAEVLPIGAVRGVIQGIAILVVHR
jgi:hypothetical protein